MTFENPDWRLEIWHAGEKAAEIRNDEWERVLADLVQFSKTRRRDVEQASAPAAEEAEAPPEPASTYWAHFAASALQRKQTTPAAAAAMADELLAEYEKRFPEAA